VIHLEEGNPSPERRRTVLSTREALLGSVEEVVQQSHARQAASRGQEDANCQEEDRIADGLCRQWYFHKRNEFELMRLPDWADSMRRSGLMRRARGSDHQG
jgi:hypothetical protein